MRKPLNVLHYNEVFFERSETFIYHYIAHLKNVVPYLFAFKFENFNLFSFKEDRQFQLPVPFPKRHSPQWFSAKFSQKLGGINFTGEEILCRRLKIKLIHAHFAPQGFFALNWFEKKRIPLITNFYGFDVSELPQDPLWKRRLEILFNKGDLFLVEGNFMRQHLAKIGCPERKIQIQRIAIPLEKFSFRSRLPKKKGERTIFLFCGRFVEKKGLEYALEAFGDVRPTHPDFEFRIIGDGPLKNKYHQLIEQRGLDKHITFLGYLTYEQYIQELNKADIFIHPSVTSESGDTEGGAPTVILEAQAMGLPVIATTHADIPNIVRGKESALLSPERKVNDLSANILHMLNNQDMWAAMGKAGRDFVNEFHDIKKEVVLLEKKYRAFAL